jgi:hypothetical protein
VTCSLYGEHTLDDESLSLPLPDTKILISKISNSKIRYFRKMSNNKNLEKIIDIKNNKPKFEMCPVFPIHLPAQKTKEFVYLRMANDYQIPAKSSSVLKLQFPLEIAIFIKREDNVLEKIDVITCEPKHSRFALYGDPQRGNLCKYAKVDLANDDNTVPYVHSILSVSVENELQKEISIGKFVFPVSYSKMYYNRSDVYLDGIKARIYEHQGNQLMEISKDNLQDKQEGLGISPSGNQTSSNNVLFVMDKGFD